jgi:hypothetical protein
MLLDIAKCGEEFERLTLGKCGKKNYSNLWYVGHETKQPYVRAAGQLSWPGTGTSWNAVPIDALLGASSTRCYRTIQSLHTYCTDPYVGRGMCPTFHNLALFLLKFHIQTLRR